MNIDINNMNINQRKRNEKINDKKFKFIPCRKKILKTNR